VCNTVTALFLSLDDYDDPMMVIDDVIHPSPVRIYCTPDVPIRMSLPVYTGVVY
jgi:hypothetical protein